MSARRVLIAVMALVAFTLRESHGAPVPDLPVEPAPVAIRKVAPIYPDSARKAHVRGTVLVQARVGSDGRVKETRVVRSVRGLDHSAVAAAADWDFKPVTVKGKPVSTWVRLSFRFGPGDWRAEDEAEGNPGQDQTYAVVVRADTSLSTIERIAYYLARIGDSTYIEYSEDGEPRAWLVAPEELGFIGAPALPLLMKELAQANDVYERTQIFYALRLAAQGPCTEDAAAQAELATVFARFPMAFPPQSQHSALERLWLDWWGRHRKVLSCPDSP